MLLKKVQSIVFISGNDAAMATRENVFKVPHVVTKTYTIVPMIIVISLRLVNWLRSLLSKTQVHARTRARLKVRMLRRKVRLRCYLWRIIISEK